MASCSNSAMLVFLVASQASMLVIEGVEESVA
jgi:hypothetical protein